jgi:hypothetical protein
LENVVKTKTCQLPKPQLAELTEVESRKQRVNGKRTASRNPAKMGLESISGQLPVN